MLIPPSPWQLRPMQLNDIEPILAIERVSFPTAWSAKGYERELLENKNAFYATLSHEEQGVVGYAGYWLLADEVHISIIAVAPAWRGRQLGELLLLNMLFSGYTHPACLATLEVRRSNEVAQALYRKYGFEEVGMRPRYYLDNDEDATLMTVEPLDEPYRQRLETAWQQLYARLMDSPADRV